MNRVLKLYTSGGAGHVSGIIVEDTEARRIEIYTCEHLHGFRTGRHLSDDVDTASAILLEKLMNRNPPEEQSTP